MTLVALTLTAAWYIVNPPVPSGGGLTREQGGAPIVGGDPVTPGEWPAVVGVNTGQICSGTLVAPNLVLTAAHCFDPEPTQAVRVFFGDDMFTGQVVISDDWGRHPDYCPPTECGDDLRDFAWVRLPMPASVEPILPITQQAEFDERMRVGAPMTVVGFGQDDNAVAGVKREVEVALTGFSDSGREFWAGGDGKDSCSGDSGGPALVQLDTGAWRLAGVTSRGAACGEGGVYGVPLPELCWLRDSSGVDLLPAGCETCDCVVLAGERDEAGCACELAPMSRSTWAWIALLLLGIGGARSRVNPRA
jgi:hypothetical protein